MKIKILHIIPSVSAGGIETLVVSLYENIKRERFQFDFAVFNSNNPIHREHLEELGANIYFIADAGSSSTIASKFIWRIKAVINYFKLIKKNQYDAVHCHNFCNYGLYIFLAFIKGIKIRIVHSHAAGSNRENCCSTITRRLKNILSFEWLITNKIGCSDAAAKWLFGKSSLKIGKARTIYNGIDVGKFSSLNKDKQKLREYYKLEEGIHFINIGRYCVQKHQSFLIDLFCEIFKTKDDVFLNLVGFGPLEQHLKDKVNKMNLGNRVRFYKYDVDISRLLAAMDIFLLPSKWEGLPITAIEAQVSNLPTIISDTVTREVDMGLAVYLPINKGVTIWSNYILNMLEKKTFPNTIDISKLKLFDITNVVLEFEHVYSS